MAKRPSKAAEVPWDPWAPLRDPRVLAAQIPSGSIPGFQRNYFEFHGISWNLIESMELHTMELHGVPLNSMEFNGIPWNAMDIHAYPYLSRDICGNLLISTDLYGYPRISVDITDFDGYP